VFNVTLKRMSAASYTFANGRINKKSRSNEA